METKNILINEDINEDYQSEPEQAETCSFKELGICESLLNVIKEEGFEEPSEIQIKSIPTILQGKDVIATASTGSGKTLAFGSVILQNTKKNFGVQSLILAPTRELAEQIARALNIFAKYNSLKIISVYGGVPINRQIKDLQYADVVVGTPGRILDHIARNTINLSRLNILVLDEADRMLDMGFKRDVEKIIMNCPKKKQSLLFSATMSQDIIRLAKGFMNNPVEISAEQYVDPTKLTQVYYDISDNLKYALLKHLLEKEVAKLVMVFCNTRRNVDFIANNLTSHGIDALPIHGGFSQEKRSQIMEKFNSKKFQILICTDVAARGLDIQGVSHVYNYDMPPESKEYLHRIGRTARAGNEGKVINIVASRDYENFGNVLKNRDLSIKNEETPEIAPVRIQWMERSSPRGFRRSSGGFRGNSRGNSRESSRDNHNRPYKRSRRN
ncbi:MAG: DEAD/DEAH box helicase [Candidatus Pacearchaeota archaeon]